MTPRIRRAVELILAIVIILTPVLTGLNFLAHGSARDNLDVYSAMLVSPAALVLPVVAVLVGCLPLYLQLGDRFIANTRSRVDIREHLLLGFVRATGVSFLVFFLYAFIPFLIAFVLWPLIGNPSVDPAGYRMTAAQAHVDALSRNSYSFLLAGGDLPYGVTYSIWVGFSAGVFTALGFVFLLTVANRVLALSLPFVIFVAGTLAAALVSRPNVGFLYSIFPAGLQSVSPIEAAAPIVLLGVVTLALVAATIGKSPTNARLS